MDGEAWSRSEGSFTLRSFSNPFSITFKVAFIGALFVR